MEFPSPEENKQPESEEQSIFKVTIDETNTTMRVNQQEGNLEQEALPIQLFKDSGGELAFQRSPNDSDDDIVL